MSEDYGILSQQREMLSKRFSEWVFVINPTIGILRNA